jgi:hypothetical protein
MWDRGEDLNEDVIEMSVFDACGFSPKLSDIKKEGQGVWGVSYSWGG